MRELKITHLRQNPPTPSVIPHTVSDISHCDNRISGSYSPAWPAPIKTPSLTFPTIGECDADIGK